MRFEPKEIVLRDGTRALLRSPRREDAEALIAYLCAIAEETDFRWLTPTSAP